MIVKSSLVSIDHERALAAVAGDEELLAELAVIFDEDLPTYQDAFERYLGSNDAESIHRVLHKLKGATAPFFADPLAGQLASLMASTAAGDLTSVTSQANDLVANLQGLKATLVDRGLLGGGVD